MIKDSIEKTIHTLEERGIPKDSFWSIIFKDGSEINEKECNWSSFSEKKQVGYIGSQRIVNVSKFDVAKITCVYEGMEASIEVPEGCEAYQAIRSESLIIVNNSPKRRTVGRIIGIVKDGEVIEEKYLDGIQNKVTGWKK